MDGCAIVTPAKSENRSHKKDMKEPTKKDDLPMLCQVIDDRKPPPEDIVDDGKLPAPPKLPAFPDSRLTETVSPPTQDDNGLIFGPSGNGRCFTMDDECAHDTVTVKLNEVGQYVVFPSLW